MIIRKGLEADVPSAHKLVIELAEFENSPDEVSTTIEDMIEDGFGDNPAFGFYVAEEAGQIVGMALYYLRYSTWKGRMLYLEDLIVKESNRQNGVGALLMDAVMLEAKKQDCNGVQWQVLDWNEPAIKFYKKYNADIDDEWMNFRIMINK